MNKNEKDIIKQQKAIEIIDEFTNNLPADKIKFDEFSILEEITNTKLNYQQIQNIFAKKMSQIDENSIKTVNKIIFN